MHIHFEALPELFGRGGEGERLMADVQEKAYPDLLASALRLGAVAQEVDGDTSSVGVDAGKRRREITQKIYEKLHDEFGWRAFALIGGGWFVKGAGIHEQEGTSDEDTSTWKCSPYTCRGPWKHEAQMQGRVSGGRAWGEFYWTRSSAGTFSTEDLALVKAVSLEFLRSHSPADSQRIYRVYSKTEIEEACAMLADFSNARERACLAIALLDKAKDVPKALLALKHIIISTIGAYVSRIERFQYSISAVAAILARDMQIMPVGIPDEPQDIIQADGLKGINDACVEITERLEVSNIAIFLPDPQGELMWCIGGSHLYPYALRTQQAVNDVIRKEIPPAPFRVDETRDRPLSFLDKGELLENSPAAEGCRFMVEQILERRQRQFAGEGPWVFAAAPLSAELSPLRQNAVIAFQGRDLSRFWISDDRRQSANLHPNLQQRLYLVAMRLCSPIIQTWTNRMRQWRQFLQSLYVQAATPFMLCKMLAERLRADVISVWAYEGNTLRLRWWSAGSQTHDLWVGDNEFDTLPFFKDPYFQHWEQIKADSGFIASPRVLVPAARVQFRGNGSYPSPLGQTNVGTVPIRDNGGRVIGLLRIDGGQSLFADLLPSPSVAHTGGDGLDQPRRSESRQYALLKGYKPPVTPTHIQEEAQAAGAQFARWLTGDPATPAVGGPGHGHHSWKLWVEQVKEGHVKPEDAVAILQDLHKIAPTYVDVQKQKGITRQTFGRDLKELVPKLGRDNIPWLSDSARARKSGPGKRRPQ